MDMWEFVELQGVGWRPSPFGKWMVIKQPKKEHLVGFRGVVVVVS